MAHECPICGKKMMHQALACDTCAGYGEPPDNVDESDPRTLPERIREWVEREFNPEQVDRVTQDLLDVATGNRDGDCFELEALHKIAPEHFPAE